MTLAARLLRSADRFADKTAAGDARQSVTYGELLRHAVRLAEHIRDATAQPRVGILLPPGPAFAEAFFACQFAQKAVVPLSQILKPVDLHFALTHSGVDAVVTTGTLAALLDGWDGRKLYVEKLDLTRASESPGDCDVGRPEDAAAILYTAGSETTPKGVVLSHRNLLANVDSLERMARLTPDDVYLGVLPMSHAFALLGTLVAPVSLGARVYYVDRFIPSEIGDACLQQKATLLLAIPTMYNLILRARDLAWAEHNSLRLCVAGGEVLPRGVAERFEDVFCKPLLNGYGMTETSPVISLNLPWANKLGSVGRPIPGTEVHVIDDDARNLGRNTEGEIALRGDNIMLGYHNDPRGTAERYTADGFFRTGDMGLVDDDGYLFIRGRKKELIIISGENVSPAEIEAVLLGNPMVADAAVIGMNHETRGEAPVAFVIGRRFHKLTAKDLRQYCRERMAAFKVPRQFVISDRLPRNALGKIQKRALPHFLKELRPDGPPT